MRLPWLSIGCLWLAGLTGPCVIAQEKTDPYHRVERARSTPFQQSLSDSIARYKAGVAEDAQDLEALRDGARAMLRNQFRAFAIGGHHNRPDDSVALIEERLQLIDKRRASMEQFVDLRMEMLAYRAEDEAVPDMVSQSFQELCRELDLHVRPDESLHVGALDPGTRFVSVHLPGMT